MHLFSPDPGSMSDVRTGFEPENQQFIPRNTPKTRKGRTPSGAANPSRLRLGSNAEVTGAGSVSGTLGDYAAHHATSSHFSRSGSGSNGLGFPRRVSILYGWLGPWMAVCHCPSSARGSKTRFTATHTGPTRFFRFFSRRLQHRGHQGSATHQRLTCSQSSGMSSSGVWFGFWFVRWFDIRSAR
jgi:hypothetical protein